MSIRKNIKFLLPILILAIVVGLWLAGGEVKEEDQSGKREISGVWVKDFLKNSPDAQKSFTTLEKTETYHIFYIPDQELFVISITGSPFNEHRAAAEEELLKTLEIDKESACKLNVDITTPSFANPNEAGKIYKLNFCRS